MTSEQVRNLVALAAANFPATQNRDMAPTAELWYRTLSDIPYPLLEAALANVLMTAKYFPTVAEIREAAVRMSNRDALSPAEAWDSVTRAIGRYGYYNVQKAMDSLQPLTRRAAECFDWTELCHADNPEIIRSQFLRIYEQLAKKEVTMVSLPAPIREIKGNRGELPCEK